MFNLLSRLTKYVSFFFSSAFVHVCFLCLQYMPNVYFLPVSHKYYGAWHKYVSGQVVLLQSTQRDKTIKISTSGVQIVTVSMIVKTIQQRKYNLRRKTEFTEPK